VPRIPTCLAVVVLAHPDRACSQWVFHSLRNYLFQTDKRWTFVKSMFWESNIWQLYVCDVCHDVCGVCGEDREVGHCQDQFFCRFNTCFLLLLPVVMCFRYSKFGLFVGDFWVVQPIPPSVTFSKSSLGSSKLKARMSLFTETLQKSRWSSEFWALKQRSKMSPQVG